MQDLPSDFQGLIALWPSMGQFGRDVAADKAQGRIFNRRNRVPQSYWPRLITAATTRGISGVTTEYLQRLYDAGKGQGR